MNELQKSMNGIKASEKLKADTLRYLEEQREVKGEGSRAENKAGNRAYVRRFALALVCLMLLLGTGGYTFYGSPVSYVSIDVNPSIELGINRLGRVVSANAYNEDGQQILAQVKLKNLSYPKAVRLLLDYETAENFLTENSLLVFTVVSENAEAILGKLAGISASGNASVLTYVSDRDCMKEAHQHAMSFGKYRAYLELSGYDGSITVEDCHGMTMGDIQNRIEGCRGHGGNEKQEPSDTGSWDTDSQDSNCQNPDNGNPGHHGHGGHHRGGR